MNNIIKQIKIDVYTPTFYEVIKAQQNDENSRFVEFILYNQGEPYVIPENVLIKLEGQRANKSPIMKPCTVANNVVTVELDKDLLYYSGVAHLKLVIYKEDENSVLSTIPFTVSIQKNPLDSNKFEKDNYSLVHQLVLQTETNTKNLNNEIERAKEAEKVITDNLKAEIIRAKKAESTNAIAINNKANIDNPTFTGIPKAPTASAGTNTTQLATTAFTQNAVANHNTSASSHVDIRDLITELTSRLNALADSDDTTLDQLSEIVAYIKSNRTLIESVTTSKVSVSDIIDNLTSTATNKPLSANQGRILKGLIDSLESALNTHISNSDIHITASERTNWNTVTNKVDKIHGKGLSSNDYTDEEKNKLAYLANNLGNVQNTDTTISSKVTGVTTATVTDSMKSNVISFKANGYTKQQTSSGKNLFDINSCIEYMQRGIDTIEIENGVVTVTPLQRDNLESYPDAFVAFTFDSSFLSPDVSYAISFKSSGSQPRVGVFVYDSTATDPFDTFRIADFNGNRSFTFPVLPPHIQNPIVTIVFYAHDFTTCKYWDIQIEKGNTATSYEPYTGGISFPNPDNPEPIQAYGDMGWFDGEVENGDMGWFDGEVENGYYEQDGTWFSINTHNTSKNFVKCSGSDNISIVSSKAKNNMSVTFFDNNKAFISCLFQNNTDTFNAIAPSNAKYYKVTFTVENSSHITVLKNGMYCAPVKSVGKNLLNLTFPTTTVNGITCTNNGDGTYTLNGTSTGITNFDIFPWQIMKAGKYKFVGCPKGGSRNSYCIETNTPVVASINNFGGEFGDGVILDVTDLGTANNIVIRIVVQNGITIKNLLFKPMLTTDLTATYDDFRPYQESIALIPTTQPFYEGDYIQLNTDGTGVEHREKKRIIIDGNTLKLNGTDSYGTTGINYAYLFTLDRLLGAPVYSNIGVEEEQTRYIEGISITSSNLSISVCLRDTKSGITSTDTKEERIAKVNAWCQSHPVEVVYELATPTDTPLTDEQLSEIKKLMSFENQTTFSTDPYNAEFEVEYYKNTENGTVVGGLSNALNDTTKNLSTYAKKSIYDDTTMNLGRRPDQDIGLYSVAQGCSVIASGVVSHAEGQGTIATGDNSHAEGFVTNANGDSSHAEGFFSQTSGYASHAEGYNAIAGGYASHAQGYKTSANNYASHVSGKFNATMTTGGASNNTTGHAFVIGNGTASNALSNAFSVMFNGVVKAKSTITGSTTADYAEFFEWIDGNPEGKDRVGRFVTLDGDKIRYANEKDDYILGIVSGEPFVLGNGDCDTWNGMYLKDEFNRTIYEPAPKIETIVDEKTGEVTFEEVFDENGNPVYEGTRPVLNPEYDSGRPYVSRFDRPEWSPVGMLGILSVYDDGTCKVNGYCKCNKDGIATKSDTGYRVIARVSDNIIKVNFRP